MTQRIFMKKEDIARMEEEMVTALALRDEMMPLVEVGILDQILLDSHNNTILKLEALLDSVR